MSSDSVSTPQTQYLHRRTKLNTDVRLPLSPPDSPSCSRSKMTLQKGVTFHVPPSPPTPESPVLSIPHLPRRTSTSTQTLLHLMLDKEDGAATKSIAAFDKSFLGLHNHRQHLDPIHALRDFIARSVSTDEELDHQRRPSADFSDSGIGSSIASDEKDHKFMSARSGPSALEVTTEKDATPSRIAASQARLRSVPGPDNTNSVTASAVTRSISPGTTSVATRKTLSNFARRKINDNIFQPILRESRFKFFHPLVKSLGHRSRSVKCLRDLEKSLIFEPLKLSVPRSLYRSFGEFSIQLVLDTYSHLSEPEQRRAADRPYDNGYFLDLVQQVGRLAAQVSASRVAQASASEEAEVDEMAYAPEDEVTLEGGLSHTGNLVELVRWKNGKGISLRTNETYEPTPGVKRRMDDEIDDEIERSMARRKKNADPTPLELPCSEKGCDKKFERKCDLAKHEKTHSRPFKCPYKTCLYADKGLPTEKEKERHMNDKHTKDPKMFSCSYCSFKTKRQSNCKQHMEKKHNYTYQRSKGKGKRTDSMSTPQQTPVTPGLETPMSSAIDLSGTDTSNSGSAFPTPFEQPMDGFGGMSSSSNFADPLLFPPLGNEEDPTLTGMFDESYDLNETNIMQQENFPLASTTGHVEGMYNYGQSSVFSNTTSPLGAASALRLNTHHSRNESIDLFDHGYTPVSGSISGHALPTPESNTVNHLQPFSRNPSISHVSPIAGQTFTLNDGTAIYGVGVNLTPQSDFLPAPPSFSPTGQDQALNEFVPSDSQFDAMLASANATSSANMDNIPMEHSNQIPDFDLYGDGSGMDAYGITMDYDGMDTN